MKRLQSFITKELKCTECGAITYIQRRKAKNRERGHIKHLYCYVCQKVKPHEEQ